MNLLLASLTALALATSPQVQSEKQSPEPFDMILVATADNDPKPDWWFKVPSKMGPSIFQLSQVVIGQEFTIAPIFQHYSLDKDRHAHVTYAIKHYGASGDLLDQSLPAAGLASSIRNPALLKIAEQTAMVQLDADVPTGKHSFEVTATDHIAKVSVTKRLSVRVLPWNPDKHANLDLDIEEWVTNYYKNKRPDEAFARFWIQAGQKDAKGKAKFMEWFEFAFFAAALKDCLPALDAFDKKFELLHRQENYQLCLLYVFMGEQERLNKLAKIDNSPVAWAREQKSPSTTDEINSPPQLDMLWAEFLATGRCAPVLSIVNALDLGRQTEADQSDSTDSEATRQLAFLGLTAQSAAWSLGSNAKQHERVFQYLHWILERGKASDHACAQLRDILDQINPK